MLPVKLDILNEFVNEKTILNYAIDKVNFNINSIDIVKYLIDIGVKLEYENKTQPLIQIVEKNNIVLLDYILKKKININIINKEKNTCLNIINNQIKNLKTELVNKEYNLKFYLWKSNLKKKYKFLFKEFNNIQNYTTDINLFKQKLMKLKK